MAESLPSWERKHYVPSGGEAFLFYVAFGEIAHYQPLDAQKYRCGGVPEGFEVVAYDRVHHGEYMDEFHEGYIWHCFQSENPQLAKNIFNAPGCVVIEGSQKDPETLNYFRDCIGLLEFFLDHGACAIYDPQMFHWWSPEQWHDLVFAPAAPLPRQHVVILYSEEQSPGLMWFHTRGMRKFGRPDISVHGVGPAYRDAVIDMCERFIELQAFGGSIPEGQSIRMASLPPGGVAHHRGDLDDPEFNNVHIEIVWPEPGLR